MAPKINIDNHFDASWIIFPKWKLKEPVLQYLFTHSPTVDEKIVCSDDCSVEDSFSSKFYV